MERECDRSALEEIPKQLIKYYVGEKQTYETKNNEGTGLYLFVCLFILCLCVCHCTCLEVT